MFETILGGLTERMLEPMVLIFLAIMGINLVIGLIAWLLGAESKRKITPGFVFVAIIIAPLIEEIIFRGPIYLMGELSMGCWLAIIVWSGIVFGLLHGIINEEDYEEINGIAVIKSIIACTFIGIFLGYLVIITNSLLSAMIVHALINISALLIIGIGRTLKRI